MGLLLRCESCTASAKVQMVAGEAGEAVKTPDGWRYVEVSKRSGEATASSVHPFYLQGEACIEAWDAKKLVALTGAGAESAKPASLVAQCERCRTEVRATWREHLEGGRLWRRLELPSSWLIVKVTVDQDEAKHRTYVLCGQSCAV